LIVAVIPARGGSKRIPRKNIRDFAGKPMIAWSILAARATGLFDRVIVSTDDAEIADVAREWGGEVPFLRPDELSDDFAGTTEVIAHATSWLTGRGEQLSAVCCIYATAPLIQLNDLICGWEALQSGDWAYTFSVTDFSPSIYRAFRQHQEGGVEMLFPEFFTARSQDLPSALHDAAQFYWGRPAAWTKGLRIFDRHSKPVPIPRWRVQDIDDLNDWIRAEMIFKQLMSDQAK
jgi:pseudaminic acid cytidylyltransferase